MEGVKVLEKQRNLLYPLMLIAAVTVIVFSIVGIATMLGWLPGAQSMTDPASRTEAVSGMESAPARALPSSAAAERMPAPGAGQKARVTESGRAADR